MSRIRPIVNCARCHRDRRHRARGLCDSCHVLTGPQGDGTRDNYPLINRRNEDTVEDYAFLRGQGLSLDEIAARLNRAPDYLRQVAKKAGGLR